MMKTLRKETLAMLTVLALGCATSRAAVIRGTIRDAGDHEPLIGATVMLAGTGKGVTADVQGKFEFAGLRNGTYRLNVSYVSYKKKTVSVTLKNIANVTIDLEADDKMLDAVTVVGQARKNTESAVISGQKQSLVVQTGISAQQISKSQDKDASEVIRRVPGISIIDEKFVMVRGLSQRYNNVWLNNGAVPSSEADTRAFSFDIIPSSQLDNLVIVKSAAPEYPSDFSGGFILVNTKDIPQKNDFSIAIGSNINDQTHFKSFSHNRGSSTDWLGFDNGLRNMQGGIHANLRQLSTGQGIDLLGNGFNNDWTVKKSSPLADLNLNASMSRRLTTATGRSYGMLASVNYSNSYKTYRNMENSLFGAYDQTHDRPNYLRHSVDNQFSHDARLGAMLNFTYVTASGNSHYELKNIFNQLGKNRYTYRKGTTAQSDNEESAEYYYSSRTTFNTQLTGKHTLGNDSQLDWSAGYAYANHNMPDRRRYAINDALEAGVLSLSNANDINREYTKLDENIFSANANYRDNMKWGKFTPTLKTGLYGEYRSRRYDTRTFIYNWDAANNTLPTNFRYLDIPTQLLQDENYGPQGLYLLEKVRWSNNYSGNNRLAAAYAGLNMPFGAKFNVYAGVRFEHNKMELIANTKDYEKSHKSYFYTYDDLFPSANATFKITDKQQLRLSYGRTTNRPEFREVSPSVFYDFDLASNVQGNYNLKPAYVDNVDFGYSLYPSEEELISLTLFYKHFNNPIEWTYTVSGGTDLTYSFMNAQGANNYGAELDIRKNLDFIGLHGLSWNFNGSLIRSRVTFPAGSKEKSRPMQGQSPYLVNTGFFYQMPKANLNVALLYNRIGKRIIGVGRSLGSAGDETKIPDSYEMPRNSVDLSLSKKFGQHWEVKASVRDLLAEKVTFKQFETSNHGEVDEVTRQYKPGRNFNLNVTYKF
jgi:outer membrane receptor protein involved in Fe transport